MARLWCCALLALLPMVGASCGGPSEPSKTPDTDPTAADDGLPAGNSAAGDDAATGAGRSDRTPASIKTTGAPLPDAPDDFEITYRDCKNVHGVYERLLRQDELAKLDKQKLPPKQHQDFLKRVDEIVEEGSSQWISQCEGIVGSVQVKSRWRCAQTAQDIARFNGCMDGKFDGEAE